VRTKLVFSLRQPLEKPLSLSWFYIANASVSNPLDLPTAATSSSKIENLATLEPRPGRAPENTFCEHDNSRRRLYGSAVNNISIRDHSRRGERSLPRKIADKRWRDASSSSGSKRRQAPLSLKGCNFSQASRGDYTIGPNDRATRQHLLTSECEWLAARAFESLYFKLFLSAFYPQNGNSPL